MKDKMYYEFKSKEKQSIENEFGDMFWNVFSQHGEDGLHRELLLRLEVNSGWLVEVGTRMYNNLPISTIHDLAIHGTGTPTENSFNSLHVFHPDRSHSTFINEKITSKKINLAIDDYNNEYFSLGEILNDFGVDREILILSVLCPYSIDIWKNLHEHENKYRPKIVTVQINSEVDPYVSQKNGDLIGSSFSEMFRLAKELGYEYILHRGNITFIRKDLKEKVLYRKQNKIKFRSFNTRGKQYPNILIEEELFEDKNLPIVQLTILARDKEKYLKTYLKCIDNIDYDKQKLEIYIHTNNNFDKTHDILYDWFLENINKYRHITFNEDHFEELKDKPGRKCENDWYESNGIRLKILGEIRQKSFEHARNRGCEFYFVCDVDNFFPPECLKHLVRENKPIIAPMMVCSSGAPPRSFFNECLPNGYFKESNLTQLISHETIKGVFEVPLVHICYLMKTNLVETGLTYRTDGRRMEFVTFAECARELNIKQYVTNEVKALYEMPRTYEEGVDICRNYKYT